MPKIKFYQTVGFISKYTPNVKKINSQLAATLPAAALTGTVADKFEKNPVNKETVENKSNKLKELLAADENLSQENIESILNACSNNISKLDYAYNLCKDYKKLGISPESLSMFIASDNTID